MAEAKHGAEKKCPICQAQPPSEDDLLDHVILCSAQKVVALTAAVGPSPLPDDFDVKKYTLDVKLSSHADKKSLTLSLTHNTSKHVFSALVVTDDLDDLHTALLAAASNGQFTLSKPPATDAKRKGSVKALIYGHAYYLQPVGTETQRVHRIVDGQNAKALRLDEELASLKTLNIKNELEQIRAENKKQNEELAAMRALNTKQGTEIAGLTTKLQQQGDELATLKAAVAELKSRAAAPPLAPVPAPLPVVVSSQGTAPSEAKSTITAGAKPKLLLTFGSKGTGDGQFIYVQGVAVSPDDKIWVAGGGKVQAFSADGKFLFEAAKGSFASAWGIAFAANGEAYIVDRGREIVVCRADGSFVRKIGSHGTGNGQFGNPYYLAIDSKQGLLFVADHGNQRVQVLKLDGNFVRAWGSKGSGDGQFSGPIGIAVNSAASEVAVSEVFDYSGKLLRKFGSPGSSPGQFNAPYGMAVDSAGNWIVSEYSNNRVQVFSADGTFITAFGERGSGPGQLTCPWGVCVAPDGRVLIADAANYRVQVFGF